MRGLIKLIPIIVSVIVLLCATTTRQNVKPMYTSDIAITSDDKIVIANKGTNDVTVIATNGEYEQRWEFTESPTGVAISGSTLYVTSSQAEGYLTAINLVDNSIIYKSATGMGACSPIISNDGSKVYVLNRYRATISEVDAAAGNILREVAVLREPCAATLTPDGKYLYVNNFLPAQRADVDYVAADVSIIDCYTFQKVKDVKLSNGSNALRGIACSADGKYVFVSHNLGRFQVPTSQLQQGWMNTNAVSVIDTSTQSLIGSMSLDEPDRGAGGVWDIACNDE